MADLKYSKILQKVFDRVTVIFDDPTPTAARFLIAVLDRLLAEEPIDGELCRAKALLIEYDADLSRLYRALFRSLQGRRIPGVADALQFQEMVAAAGEKAWLKGEKALCTDTLLKCVLDNLPEKLQGVLHGAENCAAETKDQGNLSDEGKRNTEENADERNNEADDSMDEDVLSDECDLCEAEEECSESRGDADADAEEEEKEAGGMSSLSELVAEVKRVRSALCKVVYGQDNAISEFVTGYFQAEMQSMLNPSERRPRASFLFAGPPGVGKTFLAEMAAKELRLPFRRFDMSEYADKEANLEFCGSDKVYKDAKEGNVTGFVAEHPKCVLIFDEIEKAHLCVIHLFLQILDAGRLRDNFTDEEVSFSESIIIFTTNAGRQLYENGEEKALSAVPKKVILRALQSDVDPSTQAPYFPAAICSRFASGNVILFDHIGVRALYSIVETQIGRQVRRLAEIEGIRVEIDKLVYTALLLSEGGKADARTIRSRAELFFHHELYELLRLVESEKTDTKISDIKSIRIGTDLSRADEKVRALFAAAESPRVLVFADAERLDLCRKAVPKYKIMGAQDMQSVLNVIRSNEIDFVLLDIGRGAGDSKYLNLNIEDTDSAARDVLRFLKEQRRELPVYLLEDAKLNLSEEERISFTRVGIYGTVRTDRGLNVLRTRLREISVSLHKQASLLSLEKENKLISFETAQSLSENGKEARITLFDFRAEVAIDSEDAGRVLNPSKKPNVFFRDVIGGEEAKEELSYFVEYLKNPRKYLGTGLKAPKGVLLYGPPGTGKTMLAKAMAREADVTFIATEGNAFLKKYVGEGSELVHAYFRMARKYAPAVLFIDEIDAIAKERKSDRADEAGGGTLTAFLTEMDGFVSDPSKPVFVLAATNFEVEQGGERSLDAALLRRFDRRVYIDLPSKQDRIRFLTLIKEKNTAICLTEEKIENIAVRSTGMSLAELESVTDLALRSAVREGGTSVSDEVFEEAFETFHGGEVKKWDESQLERVARHEAGHAILCLLSGETPSYLTIVARDKHGGYMQYAEREGKEIYTKEELLARIRISLGGRAAEIVYYGEKDGVSTGAGGDLISATELARRMVCSYGMEDGFGLAVENDFRWDCKAREIVNRILKEQLAEAVKLIAEHKKKADALAAALLAKNHLNGREIAQVLDM